MTDDEKNKMKGMNKLICDLLRLKAVHERVLDDYVENWQEKVEAANASGPLQWYAHQVENWRQALDLLIDQNNLTALQSELSTGGPVH